MNKKNLYLITPDFEGEISSYIKRLQENAKNVSFVQFRSKNLSGERYLEVAKKVVHACKSVDAPVILNAGVNNYKNIMGSGIHLTSKELMGHKARPVPTSTILSVACHNEIQIQQAEKISADIVVLCPIFKTPSSPKGRPLGWDIFRAIANKHPSLKIYALGGLKISDYDLAIANGATGLAAKRALWI